MSGDAFSSREERARRVYRALTEHDQERDAAASSSEPPPGVPRFSRYEIREVLGEGASAVVYRAWDRELNRSVALKLLRESAGFIEIARQRFRREAQAVAALSHPNLVHVYDAGEQDGRLYLVLEIVEGRPLSQILAEGKHSRQELSALLERAARGVAAAHEGGIIHRDLKPANILVAASGEPKVGDFGLAHLMNSDTVLTKTGSTLGTPLYMSPEQVDGRPEDITPRTDVYALGTILYEILTGHPPHTGETAPEIYRKIARDEPEAPRKRDSKISVDLQTITMKALERDPGHRYSTAASFAEDLRRHLGGESIEARPVSLPARLWRKALRQRVAVTLVVAALTVGALLGVFWRRPAAGSRPMGRIEQVSGDVRILVEPDSRPAVAGTMLAVGEAIRTGSAGAAEISFPDGSRLDLKPDTWVRELQERDAVSGGSKYLFLVQGGIRLALQEQPAGAPMSLASPHAQMEVRRATFEVRVNPVWTWVEVLEGEVQMTRMRDGKRLRVAAGYYAIAGPDGDLTPVPAEDGLVGYWNLDEGSGPTIRDSSGGKHDGRLKGPVERVEGRRGMAVHFKGGGGVLDVPGFSGESFRNRGRFRSGSRESFLQKLQRVFEQAFGNNDMVSVTTAGPPNPPGLDVRFRSRTPPDVYRGTLALSPNQWHHIAIVWDTKAGSAAIYLDGEGKHAASIKSDRPWFPVGRFLFGAQEPLLSVDAVIDDIAMFDKPLRPDAVWRLFNR